MSDLIPAIVLLSGFGVIMVLISLFRRIRK